MVLTDKALALKERIVDLPNQMRCSMRMNDDDLNMLRQLSKIYWKIYSLVRERAIPIENSRIVWSIGGANRSKEGEVTNATPALGVA